MKNLKKLTMVASAAVLALGLSACGKNDYNGSYTGYQTAVAPAATSGQTPQPYGNFSMNTTDIVQANLTSNGDTVTGTYNLSQSGYNGGINTGMNNSFQFTASSQDSNTLSNVMLVGGNCTRRGTLSSSNNGKSLTGRLSPLNANPYPTGGYQVCGEVDVTLTRTN